MSENKRAKIALIGAGQIGGTMAYLAAVKQLGDVVLYDVVEGTPQGKSIDIMTCLPELQTTVQVKGTNSLADIAGADVCIITAGVPRKPGMSRDDLISINSKIMQDVAAGIKQYAPNTFVIVVSNPLDAMVTLCQRITGFPSQRVIGMAGVLDSARYCSFLAEELNISPSSIQAMVLGGHGSDMVPIRSHTRANGIPIELLCSKERLDAIEARVRKAGDEIVALLKTGSAFYSPATCALEMAQSYLFDQKKVLPCCAWLTGEYGIKDLYVGVPIILGKNGMEKVIELELTDSEKEALIVSAEHVRATVATLG